MKCYNCGKVVKKEDNYCPECGANLADYKQDTKSVETTKIDTVEVKHSESVEPENRNTASKKNNKMGLAGFIVSLCGLCCFSFTTSIVGLVFSCIGLGKYDEKTQKNKGFAVAGLVIAIVALTVCLIKKVVHWSWWGFIW